MIARLACLLCLLVSPVSAAETARIIYVGVEGDPADLRVDPLLALLSNP